MDDQTELLREILELLKLIAEPQIAQRDERLRTSLSEIVGKSAAKAKAIALMDGTTTQTIISKEYGIDAGLLSRTIKALREAKLVQNDENPPKLTIPLPPTFFDSLGKNA